MQIIVREAIGAFSSSAKCKIKGYEEKDINDYLQDNPHLFIKSFTSCVIERYIYNTYLLESLEDVSDMVENIPIVTGVKINDNSLGK